MLENCLPNKNEAMAPKTNSSIFYSSFRNSCTLNKALYSPSSKLPLLNLKISKNNLELLKNRKLNPKFLLNKDPNLLNYYQHLCENKPLDKFPNNCDIRRFIILDLNTFETKDEKVKISSITAIEIKNMEFTGMIFHSYLNCDLFFDENNNNNNDDFLYTLFDYCKEKNNNDKKCLEKLLEFIDNSIVILHNVLTQVKLLNNELNKYNLETININNCICTLRMLRIMKFNNPDLKDLGYKISDLCNLYDIKIKENDFSLIKIIALARCVIKMMKKDLQNNDTIEIQDINDNVEEEGNNKKVETDIEEALKNNSKTKLNLIKNDNDDNLDKERRNSTKNFARFHMNFKFNNMYYNKTINDYLFLNQRNNSKNTIRTKSNDLNNTINNEILRNKNKDKILGGTINNCIHGSNDNINEENCDENIENLIADNEKNSNINISKTE